MTPAAPLELIDNQDASPLFNIPLELRRAIYVNLVDVSARHVYSVAGSDGISRLRFTPCIAPGAFDADYLDGSERCPEIHESDERIPVAGPIFKRRLLSSWGPHWMCEELAFHPQDCSEDALQAASSFFGDGFSFLRVCKRMFLEVVDDVTATTDFHVADLQTLQLLVENSGLHHDPFSLEALDRSRITKLSITLSQHLKFFRAMSKICRTPQKEEQEDAFKPSSSAEDDLDSEDNGNISFWPRLPSVLATHLPGLRKFHLWLDHTRVNYWSVVNERSILAPVEALGAVNPKPELVCVLPKVHPRIEDRQRHYLPGDADQEGPARSRLKIHRILRQRYRVFLGGSEPGKDLIRSVEDFPHTYLHPDFHDMSQAESEQFEADGWRRGVNVVAAAQARHRGRFSRLPHFFEYC